MFSHFWARKTHCLKNRIKPLADSVFTNATLAPGPRPSSTDAAAKPVASDVSETGSRDLEKDIEVSWEEIKPKGLI